MAKRRKLEAPPTLLKPTKAAALRNVLPVPVTAPKRRNSAMLMPLAC